jgi:cyclase
VPCGLWHDAAMRTSSLVAAAVIVAAFHAPARAQHPNEGELETQKLTDAIYLISGPGGNIALLVGKESAFMVDDQIQPMTPKLKQAIAKVTLKPVRFVFNTHWHGDHTGGNAVFGAEGAVIVAHDNVRKRLSTEQVMELLGKKVPPSPPAALPVITFAQSLSFHLDGEDIDVFHVEPAHTDGDSIVHFQKANVIHMGDTYFSSAYPFIDLGSGGGIEGYVRAADRVLSMAQPSTRIIPGHGAVTDKVKLKVWRDMLVTIRDRIQKMVTAGKSLADVQAAKPTAEYDAAWGGGFIKPAQLVEIVYKDLSRKH